MAKRVSGLRRKVLDDQVENEDGNIDSSQAPSNSGTKASFVDEQDFMSMSVDQEEEQMYQTDDENHVSEEEEMDSANQSDNESFDENFGSEDDDANQTGSGVEDDEVVLQPRPGTSKSPSNMSKQERSTELKRIDIEMKSKLSELRQLIHQGSLDESADLLEEQILNVKTNKQSGKKISSSQVSNVNHNHNPVRPELIQIPSEATIYKNAVDEKRTSSSLEEAMEISDESCNLDHSQTIVTSVPDLNCI